MLPRHFSIDELEKDYSDTRQLFALQLELETALQGIGDLTMVAGSESFQAAP